jgi:DNA-binding NarL/FixJ family response regulator
VTRLIVCDDAPDMRALLRDALRGDEDLEVLGEAADGDAVLALAEALQPDVVLLDIGMPGPGPTAVVSELRRIAPAAAIVVLSGFGPERLEGVAGEVAAYLPKTTDIPTIRRTLREAGGAAVARD